MKIRLCITAAVLTITFTSTAYSAKLSHHKRKAMHSGRNSFLIQVAEKKDLKTGTINLFNPNDGIDQHLKTHSKDALSFLNLCKKTASFQYDARNWETSVNTGHNEVPIPSAGWLFVSGLIGLINKKRN